MLICPFCGEENLDGADVCEQCQQPLDYLSLPAAHSAVETSLRKDRVSKLSPNKPLVVEPTAKVADVLKLLVDRGVGCVIVVDRSGDGSQQVVGIFSERDALTRLNTEAASLGNRPISEFMTPNPAAVESDARIAFALHQMDVGGYRHLPVLTDGRISGVISIRDVLRYITDGLVAAEAPHGSSS